MTRIAIIDGLRTPFCKMGTAFNQVSAQALGGLVTRELLERTGFDPDLVDEVIFGNVAQPPEATNISRVIALRAGLPASTPALTVNRNCASGFEAFLTAATRIRAGEGTCFLVGGTESMSNIPFFFTKDLQEILTAWKRAKTLKERLAILARVRLNIFSPRVGLESGLTDTTCGLNMGETAEVLAREFGISRREQDEFALLSHQRAVAAKEILREEIMPVIPPPDYGQVISTDNGPRPEQTMEALAKLRPVFDRAAGSVTAGNASQITDGAAVLLVMTEEKARALNLEPLCFLRAAAVVGVDPQRMGLGPTHAIPQALRKGGMRLADMQAVEINEAFAVQVLACLRTLESEDFVRAHGYDEFGGAIPLDKLNVNGGAIALGHPVGATGARLLLTMAKHLKRQNLNTGLVSLCVGGGQGAAIILER